MSVKCKITSHVLSASENSYLLTPEQLEFYGENGYLLIKSLFSASALNKYRDYFIQLCENQVSNKQVSFVKDPILYNKGLKAEYYINKIQELLYDEVYMTYTEDPRLLDIISQLIGDEITAMNAMIINKPPGTARHPPHQDLLYLPLRPANKILGVWTAIDPATKDNGCLYVLPGSHQAEFLYSHADKEDKKKQMYYGVAEEELIAPKDKWVYLEMEPGDTIILNPYLVHGSGPNKTKYFRKSITCHYASSLCRYIDVTGTAQEEVLKKFEELLKKYGAELTFVDIWKLKSKKVRSIKSNL